VAVGGGRYTIAAGDTLFGVARRFGVTPSALATANDIAFDARVQTGQRLALPLSARDGGPQAGATGRVTGATAVSPRPAQAAGAQPGTPPLLPTPSATPQPTDVAEVGRGKFLWPLRGQVLSEFGPKGTGQRNDGVNIAAPEGASVKASAGGEVVYAGDQVPGFGNLVLVKHPDGFVTAYAHLSRILVKNQQQVAQGFVIGEAGATGGVSQPQLHFEIRYAPTPKDKARPVDPLLLLPR
jgi:murein DD-endopeptidase MepM/ murein hydrolase activator NlpD